MARIKFVLITLRAVIYSAFSNVSYVLGQFLDAISGAVKYTDNILSKIKYVGCT